MNLTKTITPLPARVAITGMATVGVHFVLRDGGIEVISQEITAIIPKSGDPQAKTPVILKEIQEITDTYKSEQQINTDPRYAALVAAVDTGLKL